MIDLQVRLKVIEALKEFDPVGWVSSSVDVYESGTRYRVSIEVIEEPMQNSVCPHCLQDREE